MSLRVARRLAVDGIEARVVDIRWLVPLPVEDILREAEATGRVLIVDETRRSGGVSEGIVSALVDAGFDGAISRVTSQDSFIPLGEAANHVLLQEAEIEAAARAWRSWLAPAERERQPTGSSETSSRTSAEGSPREHLTRRGGEEGIERHVFLADEARARQRPLGEQLDHRDRPGRRRPRDRGPRGAGDDPRTVDAHELLADRRPCGAFRRPPHRRSPDRPGPAGTPRRGAAQPPRAAGQGRAPASMNRISWQ